MRKATSNLVLWQGIRDGTPFIFGAAPFGMVFGVLASEAGLNIFEVMAMNVLVVAGASQFAALAQMQDAAPVLLVVAAALTVNLRMAMYSASIGPHFRGAPLWQRIFAAYLLVDNAYVVSITEYERRPERPVSEKVTYYFGNVLPVALAWYLACFVGAYLGKAIPPEYGLDFAVPIAFIAIVAPLLRTIAHVAAAMTSIVAALALAFLPYSLGLFVAALLAMIVGAEIERRMAEVGP